MFVVPIHAVDLELQIPDRFCVNDVWEVVDESSADVIATLEELEARLFESDSSWARVRTNDVFDKLYSVMKYFNEVSDGVREKFSGLISATLNALLRSMKHDPPAVADAEDSGDEFEEDADADTSTSRREAFKHTVFLLCEVAVACARLDTDAAAKSDKPQRGKAKSGEASGNRLHVCLEKVLDAIAAATDSDFNRLWPLGVPEEEFIGMMPKTAFSVIDSPSVMKNKAARASAVQIAATALARFPVLVTAVTIPLLHSISSLEHTGGVVGDVLGNLSVTFRDSQLLKEILREMGRLNTTESKDTSGISNVSKFLVKVSETAPREMLANLAVLLPHLDGPSYSLRSGIVTAMGTIIAKVFPQSESAAAAAAAESSTASVAARDTLLDVLQERIRDIHANTRGSVLRVWAMLCAENALPIDRLQPVAAIAVDRLKDKTSTVRSLAMQLVGALLQSSPFGQSLNPALFTQLLDAEDQWLASKKQLPSLAEGEEEEEEATPTKPESDAAEVSDREDEQRHANSRAYLMAALKFSTQMGEAVPLISQIMGSSTKTEVQEAVRFMSRARSYGLPGLKEGLQRMLTLVWSSEQSVKDEVVENFTSMYFTKLTEDGKKTVAQQPQIVAINLVALTSGASLAVITSLDEIIGTVTRSGAIEPSVIKALWELVGLPLQATKEAGVHEKHMVIARGALSVLAMVAKANPEIISSPAGLSRLREVLTHSFDLRLARHACVALQAYAAMDGASEAKSKLMDEMLGYVIQMIRGDWNGRIPASDNEYYFCAAENGISLIFSSAPRPEEVCEHIVKHMLRRLFGGATGSAHVPSTDLSQLMFVSGHVAMKLLVHTEGLASKLRKAHHKSGTPEAATTTTTSTATSTAKGKGTKSKASKGKKGKADSDSDEEEEEVCEEEEENIRPKGKGKAVAVSSTRTSGRARAPLKAAEDVSDGEEEEEEEEEEVSKRKPKGKKATAPAKKKGGKGKSSVAESEEKEGKEESSSSSAAPTDLQTELGLNAAAEEADNENMADIAENNIVYNNLLGSVAPLIVRVVAMESGIGKGAGTGTGTLLESAVLSLCKFMCVSSDFCSKHLQLVFTVMEGARDPGLRATISIALGDLAFRFPNLLEPWTARLYSRLRDEDARVRKNTLMVLTHLVLNDMVKIKGQISEIAICLEDSDPRVKDLTKMFFSELSKRGNSPIYNLLPDVLSCLSRNESLSKVQFRSIMRYLLSFISKDKQSESLVDKLTNRFQNSDDPVQWREIAFCIAQLQMTERSVKSLVENLRMYKHALADEGVCATMRALAAKVRKSGLGKGDLKEGIQEWERQILAAAGAEAEGGDGGEEGEPEPAIAADSRTAIAVA